MPNAPRCWLFAISLCLLESCSSPPDVPACEHFAQRLSKDPVNDHVILTPSPMCEKEIGEPECGHCVWILSGKEQLVGENKEHWLNGKPWSQIRRESVYLPAEESYAPIAKYVINQCKKNNCDDQVNRFKVKLGSLKGVSGGIPVDAAAEPAK